MRYPYGTRVPFAESFGAALVSVPLLIVVFAILFVVTDYRLDAACLYVQRLLEVPLSSPFRASNTHGMTLQPCAGRFV